MELLPEDRAKGLTEKDLYSKYAQEVIALANTAGGAMILGIKDKSLALEPLANHDPLHKIENGGMDDYIRDFVRPKIWPNDLKWTNRGKVWELMDKTAAEKLLTWLHRPYRDPEGKEGEVVVVLVRPFEKPQRANEENRSFPIYKRGAGDWGGIEPIYNPDRIDKYLLTWKPTSARYAAIRDEFDADCQKNDSRAVLNEAIRAYYVRMGESVKARMAAFTPLDACESAFANESGNDFLSPEAVELVDDDETWLDAGDEGETDPNVHDGKFAESGCGDESSEVGLDTASDRPIRQGDLLSLLGDENRVIVSGEPGGGKTTCLQYFAFQFCKCADGENPVLALFVPMGQWGRVASLERMMVKVSGLTPNQLSELVSEKRLRLIIDAVNECPDTLRPAAIRNICLYLHDRPELPAVIATRHPEELREMGFPVFRVKPMDVAHRLRYLEGYLHDSKQAAALMNQILTMPGGETIAENPMLLRLVVEEYKKSPNKSLPSGRAGLYRRSLRGWRRRETGKIERSGVNPYVDEKTLLVLLSELAYRSRLNGYRDVPLEFVREIWGDDSEQRIQKLCQCPVVYLDEEFVRFRHETFGSSGISVGHFRPPEL